MNGKVGYARDLSFTISDVLPKYGSLYFLKSFSTDLNQANPSDLRAVLTVLR
jgi:hypothetical protein